MGSVTFSLDSRLVQAIRSIFSVGVLVETGTYRGDTVAEMIPYFSKIFSIELSERLWVDATQRFREFSSVTVLHGSSNERILDVLPQLQNIPTLYWLDAHWCVASDTAGELSQCPLLDELRAIGHLNSESVVLIDDARLFLAPPLAPHEISQWPTFHEIIKQLYSIGKEHELMVVNDVIAFYPKSARSALAKYAQEFGVDWLLASNCMKENGSFMRQLEDKERVIKQQHGALLAKDIVLQEMERVLQEKDSVIQEQSNAIRAYRAFYRILGPFMPFARFVARPIIRLSKILSPRLGNLNQYAPRPMNVVLQKIVIEDLTSVPKFSIVTPSFGQGKFVERTVLSVVEQEYPNCEYFVQDGGSTDATVSVLKEYENRLSGWISEKDSGQSQAINKGFSRASGEIMAWINSDDLLLPGALCIVADYFNRHPDVDVVYGDRLLIDENDLEIGRWVMPKHNDDVLSWADFIPQETMFWRRRIWEKVGGQIDESFRFAMDWDLIVRFRAAGAKFAHVPVFLGAFRIHEQQKTSAVINEVGVAEMNRIRERLLGRIPSRGEVCKAVAPFLLRHVIVDICWRIKQRVAKVLR